MGHAVLVLLYKVVCMLVCLKIVLAGMRLHERERAVANSSFAAEIVKYGSIRVKQITPGLVISVGALGLIAVLFFMGFTAGAANGLITMPVAADGGVVPCRDGAGLCIDTEIHAFGANRDNVAGCGDDWGWAKL